MVKNKTRIRLDGALLRKSEQASAGTCIGREDISTISLAKQSFVFSLEVETPILTGRGQEGRKIINFSQHNTRKCIGLTEIGLGHALKYDESNWILPFHALSILLQVRYSTCPINKVSKVGQLWTRSPSVTRNELHTPHRRFLTRSYTFNSTLLIRVSQRTYDITST